MGKKSKKKKSPKPVADEGGGLRTGNASRQIIGFNTRVRTPPEGATCWICLMDEGELDHGGCACRGASGWVHKECLERYAKNKCETIDNKMEPWKTWCVPFLFVHQSGLFFVLALAYMPKHAVPLVVPTVSKATRASSCWKWGNLAWTMSVSSTPRPTLTSWGL